MYQTISETNYKLDFVKIKTLFNQRHIEESEKQV